MIARLTPAIVVGALIGAGGAVALAPALPTFLGATPAAEQPVVVRAEITPGLRPGTSRRVLLTGSNPGPEATAVRRVKLAAISIDSRHRACATRDFTMADIPQHATIPARTEDRALTPGKLAYAATGGDQSACTGATLTLRFSSR